MVIVLYRISNMTGNHSLSILSVHNFLKWPGKQAPAPIDGERTDRSNEWVKPYERTNSLK